jgi:hypothetical protein
MTAVTNDVGGFGLAFTIGAAILAARLSAATATWMCALFGFVHTASWYVGPLSSFSVSTKVPAGCTA